MSLIESLLERLPVGLNRTRASGSRLVVSEGPGAVPVRGKQLTFEMIAEVNPVAAAVNAKLSHQVATLPLRVYKGERDGEREIVPWSNSLRKLIERPAPRCAQSDFKEWLARPRYVHGNGLVAKYRGPSGLPEALLPVPWPYVSAWAQLGGPVEWWTTVQTGQPRYFPVEDSIHLRWGSSNINGLGVSPLKSLTSTIDIDEAARAFQAGSFKSGGKPGSIVVPPEGFTYKDGQKDELREEIKARFDPFNGQPFSAALVGPGFDWKTIAMTSVEAEVMAARNISREEIAMVYDLSGPMINDLTHGTYSNVEQLHRMLYVTTLRPELRRTEETIQVQLVEEEEQWVDEGLFVEFDLSEVLRGNRREEIDAASEAYTNGLMTYNQCAEMLGLPKSNHPLADEPFIASNNMTPMSHVQEKHEAEQAGDQAALEGGEPESRPGDAPKPNPGVLKPPRKVADLPEGPEAGA